MPSLREELKEEVLLVLGGNLIGVELSETELEFCVKHAFETFRQKSQNSVEESFSKMWINDGQSEYFLPQEVIEVNKIYRRSLGNLAGQGQSIDPFELSFTNLYLLQSGKPGGLLTYELYMGFNETAGRMFGREINFTWDTRSRKLTIHRTPRFDEEILIETYNYVPDEAILTDYMVKPWIRDWAIMEAKMILGRVRSKYQTLNGGPQGGTTLDGNALLQEAMQDREKLLEDLKNHVVGSKPLGFIIG